ncbi:hypothetical protein GUJ93_ZPchr0004g39574 [Zizania palustris]|uniref:Uncharacterized protein n=1 Tax=Zizania palustris TaxID=103762 RepID=A0A8J5SDX6_ZIZPA|nr:hypothetical protein GUJ93_ZPchr0004g39574 [Zizania palustris]
MALLLQQAREGHHRQAKHGKAINRGNACRGNGGDGGNSSQRRDGKGSPRWMLDLTWQGRSPPKALAPESLVPIFDPALVAGSDVVREVDARDVSARVIGVNLWSALDLTW